MATVAHGLSLRAQARQLYAPAAAYERSTTSAQRARVNLAKAKDGRRIDACQAHYLRRLGAGNKLYSLYEHGTLMEQYQSAVAPVALQLTALAGSWARLQLTNRAMNALAHALAAELEASLTLPRFDACSFIRGIAAHHFSYAWARRSPAGRLAELYWTRLLTAGDRTGPFWKFVFASQPGKSAPGAKLFTKHRLRVLANLPGELS